MKKILLIAGIIVLALFIVKKCRTSDGGGSGTPINGYTGTVKEVNGNVLTLTSGLKARLLGVEDDCTEVEQFLRAEFISKQVVLYADSKSRKQFISRPTDTVDVYAVEKGKQTFCINRQVVNQYPATYHKSQTFDSVDWIGPEVDPVEKRNLALYMKQRTFLIITPEGIGTGFFINENGLAVTNWHVLDNSQVGNSVAVLYQDDPDNSGVYADKQRNIKSILWASDQNGLDLSVFAVDLLNGETVPYFDIARRRPSQGIKVSTLGNPHGNTASFSSGVLSAFRSDPERDIDLVQYDIATNGGNSGGPVCDAYGQVIAIHEMGDKSGQGLNFGIDAQQLRQQLDKLGLKYGGK